MFSEMDSGPDIKKNTDLYKLQEYSKVTAKFLSSEI